MFIRPRRVGAYDYSEACESYRKDGKPMQRAIARWPAEHSLADALDLCEIEVIDCLLWLDTHDRLAPFNAAARLTEVGSDVRSGLRAVRYGAASYRHRLARAQRRLVGLRKAARATGITVRTGKLPSKLMLGTGVLEIWQGQELREAKTVIQEEMQLRQRREAARASRQCQFERMTSKAREEPKAAANNQMHEARARLAALLAQFRPAAGARLPAPPSEPLDAKAAA
jgi:hypothetical protein